MAIKHHFIKKVEPPIHVKYKKITNDIYKKDRHLYVFYDDNGKMNIDIRILMKVIIDKVKPKKNNNYSKNVKYTEEDFINGIIEILGNSTYWSRYKGKVSGKYLNKIHNNYAKWGVYYFLWKIETMCYLEKDKYEKLHNQQVDTTTSLNVYGSEMYGRNVKYKSKNGIKSSFINDAEGTPISLAIASANEHDCTIAMEHINTFIIDTNTKNVKNNNKYKQVLYADSQYYSKDFIEETTKMGYKTITDVNIRNTKDPIKLKKMKEDKKKYLKNAHKRAPIERFNGWMHKYPKLNRVVEKSVNSFLGLLLLGCALIVNNKIR